MKTIPDAKSEKDAKTYLGKSIAWFIANKKMRLGVVFTLWTSITTLIAGSGWVKDATSDKVEIIEPEAANFSIMPEAVAGEAPAPEIDSTWVIWKIKGQNALLVTHKPTQQTFPVSFPIFDKLEEKAYYKSQYKKE